MWKTWKLISGEIFTHTQNNKACPLQLSPTTTRTHTTVCAAPTVRPLSLLVLVPVLVLVLPWFCSVPQLTSSCWAWPPMSQTSPSSGRSSSPTSRGRVRFAARRATRSRTVRAWRARSRERSACTRRALHYVTLYSLLLGVSLSLLELYLKFFFSSVLFLFGICFLFIIF